MLTLTWHGMAILSPRTLGLPPDLHSWTQSPEGCCALVLLLDQFPRNAFRGTAATQLRILVFLFVEKAA